MKYSTHFAVAETWFNLNKLECPTLTGFVKKISLGFIDVNNSKIRNPSRRNRHPKREQWSKATCCRSSRENKINKTNNWSQCLYCVNYQWSTSDMFWPTNKFLEYLKSTDISLKKIVFFFHYWAYICLNIQKKDNVFRIHLTCQKYISNTICIMQFSEYFITKSYWYTSRLIYVKTKLFV